MDTRVAPLIRVRTPDGHWATGRVRSWATAPAGLRAVVLVSRWDRTGQALDGVQVVAVEHLAAVPGTSYAGLPGAPDGIDEILAGRSVTA